MADPYGNEDEQVRALKQWWDRNGASTLMGVGLALALVFGWEWWQQRQQNRAAEASALYQQVSQAVELTTLDSTQRATANHVAEALESKFPGTRYALQAQMLLARLAVEAGELEEARNILEKVLSQKPNPELEQVATLRLARVLFGEGDYDAALQRLDSVEAQQFAGQFAELRGDIQFKRGDSAAALASYRMASQELNNGLIAMKVKALEPVEENNAQTAEQTEQQLSSGEADSEQ